MSISGDRDHYEVLGVAPGVDATELRRAYLAMAREHHPDREGGDDARMRTINDAWATLGDPTRRRQYDLVRQQAALPSPPPWAAGGGATWPPGGPQAEVDDLDDLDDDRPVRVTIVLPRWAAMLPTGMFALAVLCFIGGMVFGPAMAALGIMALVLSVLFFFASPFVALYASRRPNQARRQNR